MLKIGLNGYGRIGRNVHRVLLANHKDEIEVVAINARSEDAKMRAHLLKYDSVHGILPYDISSNGNDDKIIIDGKTVKCIATKDAREVPWKENEVDIVVECTGKAKNYDIAARHLEGGAKKVLVTAPMKDDTPTFVFGVNADDLTKDQHVVSNASCTTNCIAPPMKLIHEKWGIRSASVSSIHSFTHSQNLLDNSGRDLRRARAATMSIIPTTTGAVKAIAKIIPELEGKIDGMAYRVPIANSSVADMVIVLEKEATKEEVNDFFTEIAKRPEYDDIIDVSDEQLVSIDFSGNSHSSIIDVGLTEVTNGTTLKLISWYDNEWGYASRLVDMIKRLGKML